MKKLLTTLPILFVLVLSLMGCGTTGEKLANISVIYSIMAVCSLALLIGYCKRTKL